MATKPQDRYVYTWNLLIIQSWVLKPYTSTKKNVGLSWFNAKIFVPIILFLLCQIYRLLAMWKDRFSKKTAFCSKTIYTEKGTLSYIKTFKHFIMQFKIPPMGKKFHEIWLIFFAPYLLVNFTGVIFVVNNKISCTYMQFFYVRWTRCEFCGSILLYDKILLINKQIRSENCWFSCLKTQKLYEILFTSTQASRSKRVVHAGETGACSGKFPCC